MFILQSVLVRYRERCALSHISKQQCPLDFGTQLACIKGEYSENRGNEDGLRNKNDLRSTR
jgi:hypothetical protein